MVSRKILFRAKEIMERGVPPNIFRKKAKYTALYSEMRSKMERQEPEARVCIRIPYTVKILAQEKGWTAYGLVAYFPAMLRVSALCSPGLHPEHYTPR